MPIISVVYDTHYRETHRKQGGIGLSF